MKLPPHLTIKNGHLNIGGHDCVILAEKYGTPLYVTSEDRICEHFRDYKKALSARYDRVQVLFAAKANGNLAVMRALAQWAPGPMSSPAVNSHLPLRPACRHRNCSLTAVQKQKLILPLPYSTA